MIRSFPVNDISEKKKKKETAETPFVNKLMTGLPISLQEVASSFAVSSFSESLSQSRSTECANALAGVAWVTRVVVTIPVDIPAISASDKRDMTLRSAFQVEQYPLFTLSSIARTSKESYNKESKSKRLNKFSIAFFIFPRAALGDSDVHFSLCSLLMPSFLKSESPSGFPCYDRLIWKTVTQRLSLLCNNELRGTCVVWS